MRRRWMAMCAMGLCIGVACVASGRPGIIVTTDGRRLEGEVTEKTDNYTVNIHGVDMTLARSDVANVTYPDAYNKEFAERFAKLPANDVTSRIAMAREAFERRQYGLAREALDSALKIDPNNREATDLQNTISSQMRMEQSQGGAPVAKNVPTLPPNPTGIERRLLDANTINFMRQKELQSTDRLNVQFLNNVEKRFMRVRNLQFNDFNALKPVDKALKILEEGDDTMKADVKILGDPASIADYRRAIQPLVLNGCAASNCHGGPKGGDFVLYNPADNDSVVYTDLLILMRYRKKVADAQVGIFNSPQREMIERGHGALSLLAQLGLPTDISDIDHPKVQGYEFVFQNMQDLRYRQVVDWMNKSLKQPPPDYSMIRYDPPMSPAAQAPPALAPQQNPAPVQPPPQPQNPAPAQRAPSK